MMVDSHRRAPGEEEGAYQGSATRDGDITGDVGRKRSNSSSMGDVSANVGSST